ncbi:MAG: Bug family tripartite tricarboxylate transporter substrate binding protein [Burkholderiaceae bacterium]
MNTRRHLISSAAALVTLHYGAAAHAQAASFPSRPVRFVVPFAAGSGADSGARAYGDVLGRLWGQPVQVENRPGASGAVAAQAVKAAPADGHTVFIGTNSPMAVNPVLSKSLPYDPFKDFRPVHGMLVGTAAFIVKGDSPYRNLRDLLEAARKEGKTLNVGSYSEGYMLIARWLGLVAGVQVNYVNYKGGVQSQTDVAGGQLDLGVNDLSGTAALVKDGRLRVLAITGDRRDPRFSDVPTMLELGFAGFETYTFAAFYVRSETPDDITARLAEGIRFAMNSPEGKNYQTNNATVPLMLSLDAMRDFQRSEYERFKKVAEQAGIQPK